MTQTQPADIPAFLVLGGAEIARLTEPSSLIDIAEDALRKTSDLTARQDVRRVLDLAEVGGACLSIMYAAIDDAPLFGAKVLSVFPENFTHGLPSHRGGILLFERTRGRPVALIDGGATTAWRTAAASAAATRLLARPEASVLTVMGYGEQAHRHVELLSKVRPLRELRVWGRDAQKAEAFAALYRDRGLTARAVMDAETAVRGAEIVCTVTSSRTPVLCGDWLSPGTHVNAVGASVPSWRELDDACLTRAGFWVDYLPMALTSAGEVVEGIAKGLIAQGDLRGEVGAAMAGQAPGRRNAEEITLYRSLGVPAQDIEFANHFVALAQAAGLGTPVALEGAIHA
ncbi:ornithine cyclodeaminase family protein [Pararhodobacter sp. CCB-MM2]|uniref:ornithine cyclodeaminase family protein n=1 Tax=Pararhodobacter sp. CCB-MM2 TaxID=1786003 RepID=UPI000832EEA2|nr:ornithine cyclodeaminase family protein [Pararhodobacter sp. CCB-MM2]